MEGEPGAAEKGRWGLVSPTWLSQPLFGVILSPGWLLLLRGGIQGT